MTPFKDTNRVTSPYGPRTSPITGAAEQHRGQDIATAGDWTVREVTGGTVLRVTGDKWRGKYVDVQTAPTVFERYQHMDEIWVTAGQTVPQGTALGLAGTTGNCTGRHLHFGVYKGDVGNWKEANAVNPRAWSGVPNTVGSHAGNSALDAPKAEEPAPKAAPCACKEAMRAAALDVQVAAAGLVAAQAALDNALTVLCESEVDACGA